MQPIIYSCQDEEEHHELEGRVDMREHGLDLGQTDTYAAAVEDAKIPIIIWVVLSYIAALVMYISVDQPNWLMLMFFTGFIALHISLYWHAKTLLLKHAWFYFVIQGMIVYAASFLVFIGSPVVLIGLYPVLLGQCIGVLRNKSKTMVGLVAAAYLILTIIALLVTDWLDQLLLLIPIFLLMNVIVISYAHLFFRQVHARLRTQSFLNELEQTHRKVEELTLANERQRMARDLHDTLAQGLAGLIMQLEAADAHLERSNSIRAKQIIHTAMERARSTLADARLVIDELRLQAEVEQDFSSRVFSTAQKLVASKDIALHINTSVAVEPPAIIKEHCLFIISEAIMNAIKHAEASEIWLTLQQEKHGAVQLMIADNGQGFDTGRIGKLEGHYGIVGMTERARLIGGTINIESEPGKGTTVVVEIAANEDGAER